MWILVAVLAGCLVDLLLGDPRWVPHPVRFMGWLIQVGEKGLRRFCGGPGRDYVCGMVLSLFVMAVAVLVPGLLLFALCKVNVMLALGGHVLMCWQIMAAQSLQTESRAVYKALEKKDLPGAREKLARIVSRDTDALDERGVTAGAVETVAENTCDGVVAPLIFLFIGGAPLGFLYKAVNTLDSMLGYKNERYLWFGRFAAKADDVFNYIPARIAAAAMMAASWLGGYNWRNAVRIYRRDRRSHPSPNSAQTESVCAGALGIQVAGANSYFGQRVEKPTIGDALRPIEAKDIVRANRLMMGVFALVLLAGLVVRLGMWLGWG